MTAIADILALGWKILPVAEKGKRPLLARWPDLATSDPDIIAAWSESFPGCNWGVKLGPDSGIIDVECDDERAEATLVELFDGDVPVTPMFESHRGRHRIFQFREGLPDKAVVFIDKLEVRIGGGGQGAQSIIPPSVHQTGAVYHWLPGLSPEDVNPAPLPFEVFDLIRQERPRGDSGGASWKDGVAGVSQGGRNMTATSVIGKLLSSLRDPFNNEEVNLQFDLVMAWNLQNEPPLDLDEIRLVFDSILTRERQRRNDSDFHEHFAHKQQLKTKEEPEGVDGWRLKIVNGRPRIFKLYAPLWEGSISLTSAMMMTPRSIMIQALEQKNVVLDKSFSRIWTGKDDEGVCSRLVDTAEEIEPQIEEHRDLVVASMLREQIARAVEVREGKKPDGSVQRMEGGDVVFKFSVVLERLAYSVERVTRPELSGILHQIGAKDYQQRRLKRLDRDSVQRLDEMLGRE